MKKTKVLVTGVFDVLHQEHLNFLKKAKQQGDLLLIGLESDARVKQIKGKGRPINNLKVRLKNLKQTGIADQVFPLPKNFSTPRHHQALIKKIKPDILAVSSHTPNQPQKRKIIEQYGGQLKVVHQHNPQVSTSQILKP